MPKDIDYVISYIDYSQKEVVDLWEKTTGRVYENNANSNYLNFYLTLKLILDNIPFIRKLHIVCKDVQILPDDVNTLIEKSNGKIVRVNESQIMPDNYISFSSGCIEMFLWKIPDLSEYFIYGNDDMIPIKKMNVNHFFEEDKPHILFGKSDNKFGCIYDLHCSNNTNLIFHRTKNNDSYSQIIKTKHTVRPIRKSICEDCFNEYEKFIMSSLYPVRFFNNFNFDLFMIYGLRNDTVINKKSPYRFSMMSPNPQKLQTYQKFIDEGLYNMLPDMICINDSTKVQEEDCKKTKEELENLIKKLSGNIPQRSSFKERGIWKYFRKKD